MTESPDFSDNFVKKFNELIAWRRDVRRFRADAIPASLVEDCLRLANLSPSVGLSQPWRFVRVRSAEARQEVISSFETCNRDALETYEGEKRTHYARLKLEGLKEAPVHLAVFCDTGTLQGSRLGRLTMPEMLHYSVVTAVHTFWLAARARGLGVGWVSILDPDAIAKVCQAHADWRLVAYLCIGWPMQDADTPELQSAGWEHRRLPDDFLTTV